MGDMTEPVLNEAVVDQLMSHCEESAERELVGKLRQMGFPVSDMLTSTIRMAAATGAKEMFVELGRRGFLPPPPIPPCPTCGGSVTDVRSEVPVNPDIEPLSKRVLAAPIGLPEHFTIPCGHRVTPTIHADGHIELATVGQ